MGAPLFLTAGTASFEDVQPPSTEVSASTFLLAGAGLFFLVSFVLNRWPQLLWRTERVFPHPPRNIAHRGGQAERPENTLLAFTYAVHDVKCPMIELDVMRTADGQIVVAHDEDLFRVTGKRQRIENTNYAEMPKVLDSEKLAKRFMEFVPNFEGFPVTFGAQRMPLLEEVFRDFPDTIINIDIKSGKDTPVVEETVALLHKYDRVNRTVFGGFDQDILNRIRRCDSNAIMSAGPKRARNITLAYYLGLLPFMNVWERVWEIPVYTSYYYQKSMQKALEKQEKLPVCWGIFIRTYYKFSAWLGYRLMTNPAFIAALKRRGLTVFGWVANTSEEFSDGFFRVGCDGLMTDRPALLQKWLEEHQATRSDACKIKSL